MNQTRRRLLSAAAFGPLAIPRGVGAQAAGTATIISGFPAGGMGDSISRPLAERLRGRYAANVIVDF